MILPENAVAEVPPLVYIAGAGEGGLERAYDLADSLRFNAVRNPGLLLESAGSEEDRAQCQRFGRDNQFAKESSLGRVSSFRTVLDADSHGFE